MTGVAPGLIETMLRVGADLPLLDDHLTRLARSSHALSLPIPGIEDLRWLCLEQAARAELAAPTEAVLRLEVSGSGEPGFTSRPRVVLGRPLRVELVDLGAGGAPGGCHKLRDRSFWDRVRRLAGPDADDAILVAGGGEVLESTIANVWARLGERWVTPAADGRILPGIGRARTMARLRAVGEVVEERPLSRSELLAAPQLMLTNAVHGPRPAWVPGGASDPRRSPVTLPDRLAGWPWAEARGRA